MTAIYNDENFPFHEVESNSTILQCY